MNCNATAGGPSHGHWQCEQEIWWKGLRYACRQTNRHTDTLITILPCHTWTEYSVILVTINDNNTLGKFT